MKKGDHVVCIATGWKHIATDTVHPVGTCPQAHQILQIEKIEGTMLTFAQWPNHRWGKEGFKPLESYRQNAYSKALAEVAIDRLDRTEQLEKQPSCA